MFRWQSFTFFSQLFIHFQQFEFLFLCSFSIAFWGCLDLFYFHLRFIKNFQIIWEEFPLFSQFFTICLYLRGIGYSTEPGRQAHTGSSLCGSIYLLVALPTAIAVGSLCACLLFFYAFPSAIAVGSLCACWLFFYAFPSAVALGSLCACWLFVYALPGLRWARLDLLALREGLLRPNPASHRVSS